MEGVRGRKGRGRGRGRGEGRAISVASNIVFRKERTVLRLHT